MVEASDPLTHSEPNTGFREVNTAAFGSNSVLRIPVDIRDKEGIISCTLPFTLPNGTSLVAIACSEGIWVADPNDPDFVHRVLDVKGVTEIAVVEAYSLVLVLADKVLHCYSLDALDPYNTFARASFKLTPAVVNFFRVGIWAGRLTIVYKKKSITDSIFNVLEPELGSPPPGTAEAIVADFGPERVYWFRFLKEFYVPVNCTDIILLKMNAVVVHPHGFEMIDHQVLTTLTIPTQDLQPTSLLKRCKASKPLGLFRTHNSMVLLCYSTFGLFVTRHGEPLPTTSTSPIIDWHGTVYAVVPAPPHIILFKAQSIEVRNSASGKLEQVLFGQGVRCVWPGDSSMEEDVEDAERIGRREETGRVQVVMTAPHGKGPSEIAQHVYDLVPVPPPRYN